MIVSPVADNAIDLIPESQIEMYFFNRFISLWTVGKAEIRLNVPGKTVTITADNKLMMFPMPKQ